MAPCRPLRVATIAASAALCILWARPVLLFVWPTSPNASWRRPLVATIGLASLQPSPRTLRRDLARSASPKNAPWPKAESSWSCFSRIYCINLDQRPDRWSYMQRQFEELRMPVQRWSAVDGHTVDMQTLIESGELSKDAIPRLMLPDDQKIFGMDLTPGAIGCAMSHYQIWIDIMSRRSWGQSIADERADLYLIVEDDCEFLPGFSEDLFRMRLSAVPDDWQAIFLGGVDALGLQALMQVAPGVRRIYNGSRETTAYVMNIEGVRGALEVCFPLMWQLDTQLTLHGHVCNGNPHLSYTVRPMSYILWPPLVEQNKEAFPTDVQKDEHPRYLEARGAQANFKEPWHRTSGGTKPRSTLFESDAVAISRQYSLVGSWDDWTMLHDMTISSHNAVAFVAEVLVPIGSVVEFQIVCDSDWGQRAFPGPSGEVIFGSASAAYGLNWRAQAPKIDGRLALQVYWDPTGFRHLDYGFGEPAVDALGRSYALVGSWNGWASFAPLVREGVGTAFTTAVEVPGGKDIEFQVICNGAWSQRMFPSSADGKIIGPSADGHGQNWKLEAPPRDVVMLVSWDPTGKRSMKCILVELASQAVRSEPNSRTS